MTTTPSEVLERQRDRSVVLRVGMITALAAVMGALSGGLFTFLATDQQNDNSTLIALRQQRQSTYAQFLSQISQAVSQLNDISENADNYTADQLFTLTLTEINGYYDLVGRYIPSVQVVSSANTYDKASAYSRAVFRMLFDFHDVSKQVQASSSGSAAIGSQLDAVFKQDDKPMLNAGDDFVAACKQDLGNS